MMDKEKEEGHETEKATNKILLPTFRTRYDSYIYIRTYNIRLVLIYEVRKYY